MADEPRAGELLTANYGWTKPTVGASDDAWGGYINADLDGIDATVHGVRASIIGDNRIINGDMRIDQRNNGASGQNATTAPTSYTLDRWRVLGSIASKLTWGRNLGPPSSTPSGFPNCLGVAGNSAFSLAAADFFVISQAIEADMISDFAWGTAQAQSVTLSFWAIGSVAGTYSGVITNAAATRSYPFSYSLAVGTWTKIVVPIPGDTAGTWVLSGNASALVLQFDLGTGATYRGPANAWATANYVGVTGSVSIANVNASYFYVTGVKLEIGTVATPFNRQSLAKSMADCQRYYQKLGGVFASDLYFTGGVIGSGGIFGVTVGIPAMRASPTSTRVGAWTLTNCTAALWGSPSTLTVQLLGTVQGNVAAINPNYTTDFITLSAEL